jgi:hypothetical protein
MCQIEREDRNAMPALVVSIPRFRLRRCRRQGHGVQEAWARRKEPSCFGCLAGEPYGLACEHGTRSAPLRCAHRWGGRQVLASGGEGRRAAASVKATPTGLLHYGALLASSPLCVIHGHRPQCPSCPAARMYQQTGAHPLTLLLSGLDHGVGHPSNACPRWTPRTH